MNSYACSDTACRITYKEPINCIKCTPLLMFCSHECLIKHVFQVHQNAPIKSTIENNKTNNLGNKIHSNNDINNIYFFKNFQILKVAKSRQVLWKNQNSEICIVRNKKDGCHYFMKIIEKKKVPNLKKIVQEIKYQIQCDSELILKLFSYSETKEYLYVIMEYAENGILSNELKIKNNLDISIIRSYFKDAVSTVKYLHHKNIVCGNICPDSFFISKSFSLKFFDFRYASYSKLKFSKEEKVCDIFGLGIMLHKCLFSYSPLDVSININIT
jgi:hypothetical protein